MYIGELIKLLNSPRAHYSQWLIVWSRRQTWCVANRHNAPLIFPGQAKNQQTTCQSHKLQHAFSLKVKEVLSVGKQSQSLCLLNCKHTTCITLHPNIWLLNLISQATSSKPQTQLQLIDVSTGGMSLINNQVQEFLVTSGRRRHLTAPRRVRPLSSWLSESDVVSSISLLKEWRISRPSNPFFPFLLMSERLEYKPHYAVTAYYYSSTFACRQSSVEETQWGESRVEVWAKVYSSDLFSNTVTFTAQIHSSFSSFGP